MCLRCNRWGDTAETNQRTKSIIVQGASTFFVYPLEIVSKIITNILSIVTHYFVMHHFLLFSIVSVEYSG